MPRLSTPDRFILPFSAHMDIRGPDDPPVFEIQLFQAVRTPADDAGHREDGGVEFQGNADHLVDEAGIEVQIRADRPVFPVHLLDAGDPAVLDPLQELEFPLEALLVRQFPGHPLQGHRPGIAERIDRMAQTVDESRPVICFTAQHPQQVLVYFLDILPVLDRPPQIAEHIGNHHVGTAVKAPLQGTDARRDG